MLNVLRRRRALAKVVLWVLIAMLSLGMLAWFGGMGSISPAPQPPQTQQQSAPNTSQQ